MQGGITALHVACGRGNKGIVSLLLDAGADANACDKVSTIVGKKRLIYTAIGHCYYQSIDCRFLFFGKTQASQDIN
jgi:hypothetical protein